MGCTQSNPQHDAERSGSTNAAQVAASATAAASAPGWAMPASAPADARFAITGELKGVKDGTEVVLLDLVGTSPDPLAKAVVKGGRFSLSGHVDIPTPVKLIVGRFDHWGMGVLENDTVAVQVGEDGLLRLTGGAYNQRIYGHEQNAEFQRLNKLNREAQEVLRKAEEKGGEKAVQAAREAYGALPYYAQMEAMALPAQRAILEGDAPPLMKFILLGIIDQPEYLPPAKREAMLRALHAQLGDYPPLLSELKRYDRNAEREAVRASVAVGQPFKDFEATDAQGRTVKLSQVLKQHKLVMLEFWASWCGPCRAEFPHIKKAWDAHHKQGFEVFAVTIDDDRGDWLKALKEESPPWLNVRDEQSPGRVAGELYGINAVPANFMIRPDGTILARDVREWDVVRVVGELLKDPKPMAQGSSAPN